jgi:DNA-binding transcriptional LysR family regulator
MDLQRLRHLCAVVEAGSLREAARLLHVSHSGLSKSLKTLEEELGARLLLTSGRGVVVTDVGRRVYGAARRVLTDVENLRDLSKGGAAKNDPLRIATFEVFSTYFAGELVERAFRDRPIVLREAIPGDVEDLVARGEVDIGLTYVAMPRVELDYLRVSSLEMGIYGRADRFARTPTDELPFCAPIVPLRSIASPSRALDGWPDDRCPRNVMYAVDMMESALDFARRGLGVLYLPSFVATLHNRFLEPKYRLDALPLPPPLTEPKTRRRSVWIVKRRSTEEGPTLRRVSRVLREVLK